VEALRAEVIDARAELPQGVDQVADRPLVHARHARKPVFAAREREDRGERPERGAGVAEMQLRRLDRKTPPTPCTVAASRSTRTPRRASASSITPVSSESSRSRIFVSPFDSAASSSTRLEMLFDPGIFTVPLARRIGSRSRCFTASLPSFSQRFLASRAPANSPSSALPSPRSSMRRTRSSSPW